MNLKHISDTILRIDSKRAAFNEKQRTTFLLHHIKELDRRRLYCDWKFTSLFDWCVRDLGLCEGSAHLRITAARMMVEIPELEEKLEQGVLNLSNISQVNQFCRENGLDGPEKKKEILGRVENLTKKEAEQTLFKISGKEKPAKEGIRRISAKKQRVSFILSDETMEAIKEVKELLGREMSSDELMKLMTKALKEKVERDKFKQVDRPRKTKKEEFKQVDRLGKAKYEELQQFDRPGKVKNEELQQFDRPGKAKEEKLHQVEQSGKAKKEEFKQVEKPRKAKVDNLQPLSLKESEQSKGTKVTGRVLSAEVKREVYARDKQCVNCGSKHRLNFDHRRPYAMGGENSSENIRLLCFLCNQRARVRMGLNGTSSG